MNKFFKTIQTSETLFINEVSQKLEDEGKEVFRFGFGQSPFSPPKEIIQVLKDNAHKHNYLPVQGLKELREAVANFHSKFDNRNISSENVVVGPGSKILISNIFNAFAKAEVIIPAPSWVSYEPQADLCGHKVIKVNNKFENRWRTQAEDIDQICQNSDKDINKILMLTSPGNPTGLSYSEEELKEIAKVAKKHEILVISDEIYGLINHSGEHASIASFYPEGTIVTSGLSKWCGAGGWRLGVAILPENILGKFKDFKEVYLGINSETFSTVTTPVQYAAAEAYSNLEVSMDYIQHERRILKAIGEKCYQILSSAGIKVHKSDGGFYMYFDFSDFREQLKSKNINDSNQLCEKLLAETGVVILPGTAFGHSGDMLTARYAYVNFDGDQALTASKRLGLDQPLNDNSLETCCPKTIKGTQKLADWLKQ